MRAYRPSHTKQKQKNPLTNMDPNTQATPRTHPAPVPPEEWGRVCGRARSAALFRSVTPPPKEETE